MSHTPNDKSGLALRISGYTDLRHIINPSSEVGPEPVEVPVTGYSVVAEMICCGNIDCRILGFRAKVLQQIPFQSDGIMIVAHRDRLETPHFEILLDKHPAVIRPALKANGQPARPIPQFPLTLHPGEYRSFFLSPVIHCPDLMTWSLVVAWEVEGKGQESPYGTFQVTGNTGFMTSFPNGESSATPVNQIPVAGHWDVQYDAPV